MATLVGGLDVTVTVGLDERRTSGEDTGGVDGAAVGVAVKVGVAGGVGGSCVRKTLAFCPLMRTVAGPESVIESLVIVPVK